MNRQPDLGHSSGFRHGSGSNVPHRATVAASAAALTPDQGVLAVGMLLARADPEMQEVIRAGAPAEFWSQVRPAALATYESYAETVYGDQSKQRGHTP